MEIKIYADVLFLTNLFMDYLLLYISMKIVKIKVHFWHIFISAFIGALSCSVIFFVSLPSFFNVVIKVFVGLVMTYVAFSPKNLVCALKQTCVVFAVSFSMGGICFSLFYFTSIGSRLGAVCRDGIFYFNFPVYKLILSCLIAYVVMEISSVCIKKYRRYAAKIYDVELFKKDKSVSFKALYDTGNSLVESKTSKGVLVVNWNVIKKLFETEKSFADFSSENTNMFIPIPYKSVSGHSIMLGFLPDITMVNGIKADVYVGISEIKFDDFYEALLPNNFDERNEEND